MCHLLLTVQRKSPSRAQKASNETSLDGMIQQLKKADVLDREQGPRFDLARSHTNLGVHIQQPEREDYAAAVGDTAHVLPGLLEWLYDESIARPYLRDRDKLPIDIIRKGGREGPSLKDAATAARAHQRQAELTAGALRAELEDRERALRARETRWWRWLGRLAFASATCFALGLCTGLVGTELVPDELSGALADALEPVTPSTAAPGTAPVAPAAGAALAEVSPPASPEPEVPPTVTSGPTCPPGMLLIPAIAGMRLGQPVGGRKNWPRPTGSRLDPEDVPAFCLDPRPRDRSSVLLSDYDAAAVARCERHIEPTDRPRERTCLSRDEAEHVCARAVPGGHLPGVLEWESAARARIVGLDLPEHEWSGERFPPAVFNRIDPNWSMGDGMWVGRLPEARQPATTEGVVLLAWNQQAPSNRHVERAFRCAARPL